MHIQIHTMDRGTLNIDDFKQESFLDLIESWQQEEHKLLAFALNDGMAYIPKSAITRIDVLDT